MASRSLSFTGTPQGMCLNPEVAIQCPFRCLQYVYGFYQGHCSRREEAELKPFPAGRQRGSIQRPNPANLRNQAGNPRVALYIFFDSMNAHMRLKNMTSTGRTRIAYTSCSGTLPTLICPAANPSHSVCSSSSQSRSSWHGMNQRD